MARWVLCLLGFVELGGGAGVVGGDLREVGAGGDDLFRHVGEVLLSISVPLDPGLAGRLPAPPGSLFLVRGGSYRLSRGLKESGEGVWGVKRGGLLQPRAGPYQALADRLQLPPGRTGLLGLARGPLVQRGQSVTLYRRTVDGPLLLGLENVDGCEGVRGFLKQAEGIVRTLLQVAESLDTALSRRLASTVVDELVLRGPQLLGHLEGPRDLGDGLLRGEDGLEGAVAADLGGLAVEATFKIH